MCGCRKQISKMILVLSKVMRKGKLGSEVERFMSMCLGHMGGVLIKIIRENLSVTEILIKKGYNLREICSGVVQVEKQEVQRT